MDLAAKLIRRPIPFITILGLNMAKVRPNKLVISVATNSLFLLII
jgi:hypothetical protein